ncbi:MAG: hypothetical protein KJP12_07295 [Acidimicrobiia bacterium]|nr:hypothetical protein [Acidimicrobiia bacterium]MBT8215015.1 hypothetical protein [Acidimicrobiia bacterium]
MTDWGWVALGFTATGATIAGYVATLVYRRRALLERIAGIRGQGTT